MERKEIVIRRSIYDETLEHKLVETDVEGEYEFVPAAPWMPIYFNYDSANRGNTIVSLDSDGFGTPLWVGDTIKDLSAYDHCKNIIVKGIYDRSGKVIVVLEDKK